MTIRAAPAGRPPGSLIFDNPILQISDQGACRVSVPGIADFLIDGSGTDVAVDAAPSALPSEIELFLTTTVLGVLCHQRGHLPLHASSVRIGSRAVVLAGSSAAGKSTLAAALVQRGHSLIADDIVAVDAAGEPAVTPAFPHLKLWRDAMEALGFDPRQFRRGRPSLERYHVTTDAFDRVPVPLAAIFLLEWTAVSHLRGVTALGSTLDAISRLRGAIYRDQVGAAVAGEGRLFERLGRIAAAVPIYILRHRQDLATLDESAAAVLRYTQ